MVNIPVNIRFVDPPPQREEDIFTKIECLNEFDCLFNTLLNNAQQKLDRKTAQSDETKTKIIVPSPDCVIESQIEIATLFSEDEVETVNITPDTTITLGEENFWEIAQRDISDDYTVILDPELVILD